MRVHRQGDAQRSSLQSLYQAAGERENGTGRTGGVILINMIHGDCMEIMKQYPDKYFQLACVDPPYRDENQPTKEMRNKINGKMKEFGKKPDQKYFNELFRISKNQIIWGMNNFIEYLKSTNCMLFWYKNNPMENYSDGEFAWTDRKSVV